MTICSVVFLLSCLDFRLYLVRMHSDLAGDVQKFGSQSISWLSCVVLGRQRDGLDADDRTGLVRTE